MAADQKMRRYELLQTIAPVFDREFVICNLGFPSQELYSIRDSERFFYMLGSMGLSSSIGLGVARYVKAVSYTHLTLPTIYSV